MYSVIDLFAGAGGLSLGFNETGQFNIIAFVEKNPHAAETYSHNFKNAQGYSDINEIDFRKIKEEFGGIDVVIGGPPCQGFSNANRQHNQAINLNNKLVKQYIRAILEIQPKAFVMENVGMLKSDIHRFYIENDDKAVVEKYAIPTRDSAIFLLPRKYVFNNAENVVGDIDRIKANKWDPKLYLLLNIWLKDSTNNEKLKAAIVRHFDQISSLIKEYVSADCFELNKANDELFNFILSSSADKLSNDSATLSGLLERPIAFQKMLMHAQEIHENDIAAEFLQQPFDDNKDGNLVAKVKSCAVYDFLTRILESEDNGYAINKGVLSAETFGIPQKRKRFILIGVKKNISEQVSLPEPKADTDKTTVHDAIYDLSFSKPFESVEQDEKTGTYIGHSLDYTAGELIDLRDSNGTVYNHIIPKTTPRAMERFVRIKPGQNFHDLPEQFKINTYTNVSRTQNTIYKRLSYNEPSGTVVNVRKSMWIHPAKDRAISVREAARLQTFPDSFRFYGPKDSQYQQVGNAVPPMLSKAIAEQLLHYIGRKDG